ncbi:MAG TPA: hypothetical protein VJL78_08830 [Candidatus Nitrosocosmicus sp.]|nr:hypothetical protein [Candidatus Nitrosocosmicus sp.]
MASIIIGVLSKKEKGSIKDLQSENTDHRFTVPLEIDTHYQLYGKHMWEVNYFEKCPRCDKRIDEFGYCACTGFAE